MSDVKRLEAELEVAKALEKLERAREAFHANRKDKAARTRYKAASKEAAELRTRFREQHPTEASGEGDAVAKPATVQTKARRG